jgi:F-type H+-transporting ATPase subunit a
MGRKVFPVVATIFFFVLFNAWLALFPFYQFLGFVTDGEIKAHLLRSAGTDLNMPLALALVSFVFVEYWGFRAHGFGYLKKFFALGNVIRLRPSGLIDAFVGFLELVSEFVRVVSFTFRLFGNMTAGEILVVMITFLVPFVATQFVFGLELLVGLIQAIIFAALTLVFLSVAVRREGH